MTRVFHPFGEFLPPGATKMIVGTFPAAQFTGKECQGQARAGDIEFFYGGTRNGLWPLLSECFGVSMRTVSEIKALLTARKIAVGDVVRSCVRINCSSLDKDLKEIEWNNDLATTLREKQIETLLFTGLTAQKWFRRNIVKDARFREVVLPSPAPAALISLSRTTDCKIWMSEKSGRRPKDFRLHIYETILGSLE